MNILITGGLGFIGVNTAIRLYNSGHKIFILDNMSRKGSANNLLHLTNNIVFTFLNIDITDQRKLSEAFNSDSNYFDVVFHLAGQVAVTTSVDDPQKDFDINCSGTFNILEQCRKYNIPIVYSSTNKVYGEFNCEIQEAEKRYNTLLNFNGIDENQNLDFHSPYGCSKGCGDQYVRDYSRIYGLKTVVLRQSCIYGYNQYGIEDQGWVSWFAIASLFNKEITVYGNGKQIRDVLFIDDLTNLYEIIISDMDKYSGNIYNVGGGKDHTLSLLELLDILSQKLNRKVQYKFEDWRPGDQKIYISDISKIQKDTNWKIQNSIDDGLEKMFTWILRNKQTLSELKLI